MTTQELVERLEEIAIKRDLTASFHSNPSLINEERETASKTLRAAASRLSEMERTIEGLRAMHKLIAQNLGEYIDREGTVDVTVALAFETARAALEHHQQKREGL